jgi:hypothetical protein
MILEELNSAIISTGEIMDGNVCYWHATIPQGPPAPQFELKRVNLQRIANRFKNILEIGFNAGHSADIILSANPTVTLTSVDIGQHQYTHLCADIIKNHYQDRHRLILKNSNKLDKQEITNHDVVIIDGGHGVENCFLDLAVCIAFCKIGSVIVIDDWYDPCVKKATQFFEHCLKEWTEIPTWQGQAFFEIILSANSS